MIYISSSCVKHKKIKDSIEELAIKGFKNIELSGGTDTYDNLEEDLISLKNKYSLKFVCHNYFPPPKSHFVLNLASLDDEIYEKSIEHYKNSINLSKKLNSKKFSIHAGFFQDLSVDEIGKQIKHSHLQNKEKAIERFCAGFNEIKKDAQGIDIYIENNVFSNSNKLSFNNNNPFMMTNAKEYFELKKMIDFKLLLDIAHLKVSCHTLNINFMDELNILLDETDYIHLSNNNGLEDQNKIIDNSCEFLNIFKSLNNKEYTLEMYQDLDMIQDSYNLLRGVIDDK